MKNDAKSIREKFAQKEINLRKNDFLAPFTEQSRKVHVKIDGVVYPFRIIGQRGSGFGIFKPIDGTCAKYIKEAPFELYRAFLDELPRVLFILAYESDQGWVAYPANINSTREVFGLDGEAVIKCVTDCERFDVIVARFDGLHFWYDGIFTGGNPQKSINMRECFQPGYTPQKMKTCLAGVKELTPEDKKAFEMAMASWTLFQRVTTEDRLRDFIENSGGKFQSYVIRGVNVEIKWTSDSGRTYNSLVEKESLDVVSAGICLSGEDKKFHLKDLPFVIKEGERRGVIHLTRWQNQYDQEHNRHLDFTGDNEDYD